MSDTPNIAQIAADLAAARAQIAELERQLRSGAAGDSAAVQQRDIQITTLQRQNETLRQSVSDHEATSALAKQAIADAVAKADKAERDYVALSQRMEAYIADPPEGSGIVKVERYMTSDGSKHKRLPDAQRRAAKLGIMKDLGLPDALAEQVVDQRDALRSHLDVADGEPTKPEVA